MSKSFDPKTVPWRRLVTPYNMDKFREEMADEVQLKGFSSGQTKGSGEYSGFTIPVVFSIPGRCTTVFDFPEQGKYDTASKPIQRMRFCLTYDPKNSSINKHQRAMVKLLREVDDHVRDLVFAEKGPDAVPVKKGRGQQKMDTYTAPQVTAETWSDWLEFMTDEGDAGVSFQVRVDTTDVASQGASKRNKVADGEFTPYSAEPASQRYVRTTNVFDMNGIRIEDNTLHSLPKDSEAFLWIELAYVGCGKKTMVNFKMASMKLCGPYNQENTFDHALPGMFMGDDTVYIAPAAPEETLAEAPQSAKEVPEEQVEEQVEEQAEEQAEEQVEEPVVDVRNLPPDTFEYDEPTSD